jgi:hypothetical protein
MIDADGSLASGVRSLPEPGVSRRLQWPQGLRRRGAAINALARAMSVVEQRAISREPRLSRQSRRSGVTRLSSATMSSRERAFRQPWVRVAAPGVRLGNHESRGVRERRGGTALATCGRRRATPRSQRSARATMEMVRRILDRRGMVLSCARPGSQGPSNNRMQRTRSAPARNRGPRR